MKNNISDLLVTIQHNNFTLFRFIAAFFVFFGHSYNLLVNHEDPLSSLLIKYWGESLPAIGVDIFFIMSGFLITGSYLRKMSTTQYLSARFWRIFPGLLAAVMFTCFVIGPLATSLSIFDYFSSKSVYFYVYHNLFLFNGIQFDLPGVFLNNPYPVSVNGSLWTLPLELNMYILIALLGFSLILQDSKSYNLFFLLILLFIYLAQMNDQLFKLAPFLKLYLYFLTGALLMINAKNIKMDFKIVALLLASIFLFNNVLITNIVKIIFLSYLIIYLAIHPAIKLPKINKIGDLSYGFYIYSFPITQMIIAKVENLTPLFLMLVSFPIIFSLAFISWHLVEKRFLRFSHT